MQVLITQCDRTVTAPNLDYALCAALTGLTPEVVQYVWHNGWKQSINDANTSGKTVGEKLTLSMKKHDALLAGHIRIVSEQARDPTRAEAWNLAREHVKRKDKKLSGKALTAAASRYVESYMALAAKRVAEAAEQAAMLEEADLPSDAEIAETIETLREIVADA